MPFAAPHFSQLHAPPTLLLPPEILNFRGLCLPLTLSPMVLPFSQPIRIWAHDSLPPGATPPRHLFFVLNFAAHTADRIGVGTFLRSMPFLPFFQLVLCYFSGSSSPIFLLFFELLLTWTCRDQLRNSRGRFPPFFFPPRTTLTPPVHVTPLIQGLHRSLLHLRAGTRIWPPFDSLQISHS